MHRNDGQSWRVGVRRWEPLVDYALWIRAAERIDVPADHLVPGPIDLDPLPPASTPTPTPTSTSTSASTSARPSTSPSDAASLGEEWRAWWRSLVDPKRHPRSGSQPADRQRPAPVPPDLDLQPAFDTPDPLGLARHPGLRQIVARRWEQAHAWHTARQPADGGRRNPSSPDTGAVVRDIEQSVGRPLGPFDVEFLLLPVRDDVIRRVNEHRYLVPERVYDGRGWAPWLRHLVLRIG